MVESDKLFGIRIGDHQLFTFMFGGTTRGFVSDLTAENKVESSLILNELNGFPRFFENVGGVFYLKKTVVFKGEFLIQSTWRRSFLNFTCAGLQTKGNK